MPDTNTFDYLYDRNLVNKITELIHEKILSLIICQVQIDELEAIPSGTKKQSIESIPKNKIPSSIGWTAPSERYNRGYEGPRTNWVKIVSDDDAEIVNKFRRFPTDTHPVGNTADLAIVYTAIKEEMNYLISNDGEVKSLHNSLTSEFNSSLKFLDNSSFEEFLETIS